MPTLETFNIHEAKTQLSRLVEQAAKGQAFVIAKAGKPMVRVVPLTDTPAERRLGGLRGQYLIPEDIKAGFATDIDAMFHPVK